MTIRRSGRALRLVVIAAVLTLVAAGCDWRGPNPTDASVGQTGSFAYGTHSVPSSVSGFGGGTIYYPIADESLPNGGEGHRFGGVAVVPGFVSAESSIAWYGPLLASHGFVVITIATNSLFDQPQSRGNQLLASLDHLTGDSPVADLVDPDRLAVMGWSMGGGGALHAANVRPSLNAAVPLAPWHTTKEWPSVQVPTLMVACQEDSTAPTSSHAIPFYESLSEQTVDFSHVPEAEFDTWPLVGARAYLEIANGAHSCVTSQNTTIARSVVPWLKRWVDGDTRYDQWICPSPVASEEPSISDYRSDCGTADKPGFADN